MTRHQASNNSVHAVWHAQRAYVGQHKTYVKNKETITHSGERRNWIYPWTNYTQLIQGNPISKFIPGYIHGQTVFNHLSSLVDPWVHQET